MYNQAFDQTLGDAGCVLSTLTVLELEYLDG